MSHLSGTTVAGLLCALQAPSSRNQPCGALRVSLWPTESQVEADLCHCSLAGAVRRGLTERERSDHFWCSIARKASAGSHWVPFHFCSLCPVLHTISVLDWFCLVYNIQRFLTASGFPFVLQWDCKFSHYFLCYLGIRTEINAPSWKSSLAFLSETLPNYTMSPLPPRSDQHSILSVTSKIPLPILCGSYPTFCLCFLHGPLLQSPHHTEAALHCAASVSSSLPWSLGFSQAGLCRFSSMSSKPLPQGAHMYSFPAWKALSAILDSHAAFSVRVVQLP